MDLNKLEQYETISANLPAAEATSALLFTSGKLTNLYPTKLNIFPARKKLRL